MSARTASGLRRHASLPSRSSKLFILAEPRGEAVGLVEERSTARRTSVSFSVNTSRTAAAPLAGGLRLSAAFASRCHAAARSRRDDLLLQQPHLREVRHHELRRRLRVDPAPRTTPHEAVVKLQVGGEVVAAEARAAEHLGEARVGLRARSSPVVTRSAMLLS